MTLRLALAASAALALAAPALAQEDASPAIAAEPQSVSRDLTGTFGGVRMPYRATVAETVLSSEDRKSVV